MYHFVYQEGTIWDSVSVEVRALFGIPKPPVIQLYDLITADSLNNVLLCESLYDLQKSKAEPRHPQSQLLPAKESMPVEQLH